MVAIIESISSIMREFVPADVADIYTTILFLTLEVAGYSILVYIFYEFVARRDVFGFDVEKYKHKRPEGIAHKVYNFLLSLLKYGLIFPIFVFFWFAMFTMLLFVLSSTQSTEQILLVSITIVSAIRILSYFKESVAKEVVKLLSLALLANFILNPSFFNVEGVGAHFEEIPSLIPKIIQFVSFPILLEWLLRIVLFFKIMFLGVSEEKEG